MNGKNKKAAQNRAAATCRTGGWIAGMILLTLVVTMDCRIWENNAAAAEPDPSKLIGRWLRPDGGYLLELSDPTSDGHLKAVYFYLGQFYIGRMHYDILSLLFHCHKLPVVNSYWKMHAAAEARHHISRPGFRDSIKSGSAVWGWLCSGYFPASADSSLTSTGVAAKSCTQMVLGRGSFPTAASSRLVTTEWRQILPENPYKIALDMGFSEVATEPFVRSSYRAKELFKGTF